MVYVNLLMSSCTSGARSSELKPSNRQSKQPHSKMSLVPQRSLYWQHAALDGDCNLHPLHSLMPLQSYEVKLSFFGPSPAAFSIRIAPAFADSANTTGVHCSQHTSTTSDRKLLDVEKATFSTDENAHVHGCPELHAAVVCARSVGTYRPSTAPPSYAQYNIGADSECLHAID